MREIGDPGVGHSTDDVMIPDATKQQDLVSWQPATVTEVPAMLARCGF
jgi:hypothetical protein